MKKIISYLFTLFALLGSWSCDQGFDELNINKNAVTAINPVYLMNNAIISASFPLTTLVFEIAIAQQIITPNGGVLTGGNYNQDNRGRNNGNWIAYYQSVLKNTQAVLTSTKADPNRANLYNMARIWRAHAAMVLTDSYGDIPYFEAGVGFSAGITLPKYDPQQAIYTDILKELDEASAALSATATIETSDVLYNGNVPRWKRFGYSLMFRAAMRLSKVDAALAKTYVAKAVAGGLMLANEDNAVVRNTAQYINAVGDFLNAAEANNYYLAAPFVNYLKENNDPRLVSIAVRYVGAGSGPEQVAARATTDPKVQIGMPMGYDNGTIGPIVKSSGLVSFYDFSQLDRTRMGNYTAPCFLVTYAQTQLLLAEAVVRGWTTGDAAALYANGIKAHMQQLSAYGTSSSVAASAIDAYIAAHPYDAAKALEQINTQYWVASFLNGPETFANLRRSGFPALTPNPYPGSEIKTKFVRRLTYPDSEQTINSANLAEAVSRQGVDRLDTPVWWDK